ncbi:hypothetical protein DFH06DRAFT_1128649 [Mycena polygramma]|nr:hypothetical protein DFH06DRAFT_1128649 [Mycena polygramma]
MNRPDSLATNVPPTQPPAGSDGQPARHTAFMELGGHFETAFQKFLSHGLRHIGMNSVAGGRLHEPFRASLDRPDSDNVGIDFGRIGLAFLLQDSKSEFWAFPARGKSAPPKDIGGRLRYSLRPLARFRIS